MARISFMNEKSEYEGIPKDKCIFISTNPNPNSFDTVYHREMARCYGLSAEAEYWDEWNAVHHASNDQNKVKYPGVSVTKTDESIYGSLLMDKCTATVIHNLIKERMTKMEKVNMLNKLEILDQFIQWSRQCAAEEAHNYISAPSGSSMEKTALEKNNYFNALTNTLLDIKRDLVDADPKRYQQPNVICPVNIWENGNNTVVQWEDGTKTVVTAEHPESKSTFAGFCAALAKKIYGTTDKVMKQIDKAVENPKLPAKRKKEEAERLKLGREIQHEMRVKERELRIKREMDQIYIKEEAKKRIDQAYEERMYEQPKKKVNKKQPQKKSKPKEEPKHE